MRRTLIAVAAGFLGAALLLFGAYRIGVGLERGRWSTALNEARVRADSLQLVVYAKTQQLMDAAGQVDAQLAAWEQFTDSVRRTPRPIRIVTHTDTIPVPVPVAADPDLIGAVVAIADSTIRTVDTARRQCLSVLDTCTVALTAAITRAERAEADAARLKSADGRRARWQLVEHSVCAASLAGNWLLLRTRGRD